MNDIVTRLRVIDRKYTESWSQRLMDEAADEIERLRDIAEALRDAFQQLTDHGDACPICWESFKATRTAANCYGHVAVVELEAKK